MKKFGWSGSTSEQRMTDPIFQDLRDDGLPDEAASPASEAQVLEPSSLTQVRGSFINNPLSRLGWEINRFD